MQREVDESMNFFLPHFGTPRSTPLYYDNQTLGEEEKIGFQVHRVRHALHRIYKSIYYKHSCNVLTYAQSFYRIYLI